MADSSILVTPGIGADVDTRTESTNGQHRQVVVLGDPSVNAGVAPVDAVAGLAVNIVPTTAGGYSNTHIVSAATTNTQNIKSSAGQLYSVDAYNHADYPIAIQFHNTAGTPTAGAGVVKSVVVQAATPRQALFLHGLPFSTGIGLSIVKLTIGTPYADSNNTAVALGDCVADISYK